MLRRHVVAVPIAVQFYVVRRSLSHAQRPVAHGSRLWKACRNSRSVPHEAGVVSHISGIHLRRPHVVEVLRNDGAQHRARPQVRLVGLVLLLGTREDSRDPVDVSWGQQLARERHVLRGERLRLGNQLLDTLVGEQFHYAIVQLLQLSLN